jgi:hypothetical protein
VRPRTTCVVDYLSRGSTTWRPSATLRTLIVWPFDAEGFIIGWETHSAVTTPDFLKKVETSEAPQKFRDFVGAR